MQRISIDLVYFLTLRTRKGGIAYIFAVWPSLLNCRFGSTSATHHALWILSPGLPTTPVFTTKGSVYVHR
jgi:hypothetical protein